MIETTTKLTITLHSKNGFHVPLPESVKFDLKYYINILIVPVGSPIKKEHIDSRVRIKSVLGNKATVYQKKFYNELKDNFIREQVNNSNSKIDPKNPQDLCILHVTILNPKRELYFVYLEKSYLDNHLIDSLKTTKENKNQLIYIGELFLKESFRPVIAEIGKFGEYLTKQFVKKLKQKFSTFKSGVNSLANYKTTGKTKINYTFIGNMLYPIYYLRNQASHPEPEIPLEKKTALVSIENLSYILRYISRNQIKF